MVWRDSRKQGKTGAEQGQLGAGGLRNGTGLGGKPSHDGGLESVKSNPMTVLPGGKGGIFRVFPCSEERYGP